jgi:SPP1 family predicted phage head-tail adaptor
MQAGKLRHQVTLQSKSVTRDEFGAEVETWSTVASIWAELDPYVLRERLTMRRQAGESVIGFRVRAPLAVSIGKRLVFDSANYDIVDVDATRKHKGELLITARAEDSAP